MIKTVHPLCSSIPSAVSQSQQQSCFQDPDFAVWSMCSFTHLPLPPSLFLPLFLLFTVSGIPEGSPVLHLLTHFINEPDGVILGRKGLVLTEFNSGSLLEI